MRFLWSLNSIIPIIPRIMPPIIVAIPIFSKEVFLFDNCISANPKINAENVVLIYERRVLSFANIALSSSSLIFLFTLFFINKISLDYT